LRRVDNASENIITLNDDSQPFTAASVGQMKGQRKITVGILDRQAEVAGRLEGNFRGEGIAPFSGRFWARATAGRIVLLNEAQREVTRSPSVRLSSQEGSTFLLFNVTIGNRFHWEKKEDQTFCGDLILLPCGDDTIAAVNEIPLEDYLTSVISSEMNASAPMEFLKAHAILSRSWLLAALERKETGREHPLPTAETTEGAVIRWYDREDHERFDVCADDHCQRYHGVTRNASREAEEAVLKTSGRVMTFQGKTCDARYSKCCGGSPRTSPRSGMRNGSLISKASQTHLSPIRRSERTRTTQGIGSIQRRTSTATHKTKSF